MGRVIKGSAASEERYVVALPPRVWAEAFGEEGADAYDDAPAPADEPLDEPFEPAIDLAAIAAQAQEVIDAAALSAEAIVAEAHARAQTLIDDAARQAGERAEEARGHAHDAGYAQGLRASESEMADMLAVMRELIASAREERHALLTSAEPELVRLAVGIAERVLHQQIALDGGVVVDMAKAAISRIVDREKITVRVNPADIERMREHRDELLALGDVKTMRVIEDQRVDRGGVILETDAGSIDAKISTQLTEVRKILHIVDDVVVVASPASVTPASGDDATLPAARAS